MTIFKIQTNKNKSLSEANQTLATQALNMSQIFHIRRKTNESKTGTQYVSLPVKTKAERNSAIQWYGNAAVGSYIRKSIL